MNLYICKCDEPEWSTPSYVALGQSEGAPLGSSGPECLACGGAPPEPPPPNYRGMEKPPVPFHAICTGMAVSMHAEIKALHGLLLESFRLRDDGVYVEISEEEITKRIEEES